MTLIEQDTGALKRGLFERLKSEGFGAFGIAPTEARDGRGVRLNAFLEAGWHGGMAWLARRAHWRGDPKTLWPKARSAIVAGLSYAPDRDPLEVLEHRSEGVISVYAQGADYHEVVKKRLARIARWLAEAAPCEVKVFVDTAPVMEKPLAQLAGLGWQGKHTNLVSRAHGSWLFLGCILTDLVLEANAPHEDHCGTCQACLDICPTKAFAAPYQLDARRCISYLTIEHDDHIPRELREGIGNRIYGCDDCLAVCPWNKFAALSREQAFHPRAALKAPLLRDLAALDDAAFRALFAGSPVKRTGRDRFVRNVLIAIGNSADPSLIPVAQARLDDACPLVRAASAWALSRLMPAHLFEALAQERASREPDSVVRAEWEVRLSARSCRDR